MLAVCRYPSGRTYLFKCDAEWNVVGDGDYDSLEEAVAAAGQWGVRSGDWHS